MAVHRLGHALGFDELHEAQLDGLIAVLVDGLLLHDDAWPGLNHGDGNNGSVILNDLGHADFLANQSVDHFCVLSSECLDLDIDAGRQIELHQRIHGLRCRLEDVEQPLVRPNLKLLTGLLVRVRRSKNRELVDDRRKWNRAGNTRSRALCRIDNFSGRLIENPGIVRLQSNSNLFVEHNFYSIISATVPAPTVRPPSRMANRSPFSSATGVISVMSSDTLSPGITISTPEGSSADPVTSVVRK